MDQSGKLKPDEFHELYVAAYELKTGKVAWQTKVAEAVPNEKGHQTSSYASASTVTDGKRIYAFFGSLGLFALDMEGNQIWDQEFSEMRTAASFGEGASPALQDNILVIPWDEEGQSCSLQFAESCDFGDQCLARLLKFACFAFAGYSAPSHSVE